MSARTMTPKAVGGLFSQTGPLMLNSADSNWLITPCPRKMNCHTSELRMATEEARARHHDQEVARRHQRVQRAEKVQDEAEHDDRDDGDQPHRARRDGPRQ